MKYPHVSSGFMWSTSRTVLRTTIVVSCALFVNVRIVLHNNRLANRQRIRRFSSGDWASLMTCILVCEGSNVGEYNEECGGDMMRVEREKGLT